MFCNEPLKVIGIGPGGLLGLDDYNGLAYTCNNDDMLKLLDKSDSLIDLIEDLDEFLMFIDMSNYFDFLKDYLRQFEDLNLLKCYCKNLNRLNVLYYLCYKDSEKGLENYKILSDAMDIYKEDFIKYINNIIGREMYLTDIFYIYDNIKNINI